MVARGVVKGDNYWGGTKLFLCGLALPTGWPCAGAGGHGQGVNWPQRPRQGCSTRDILRFCIQTTQLCKHSASRGSAACICPQHPPVTLAWAAGANHYTKQIKFERGRRQGNARRPCALIRLACLGGQGGGPLAVVHIQGANMVLVGG